MQCIRVDDWSVAAAALRQRLIHELSAGRQVLWLVSGGSNVAVSTWVTRQIPEADSQNLAIMPADERYGPEGHADSNWAGLLAAGFEPKRARLLPVLHDHSSFEATRQRYEQQARQAFEQADCIIGQFGIGEDAHIAGILPGSPAVDETEMLVAGYRRQPFRRLTLTFPALQQVNVAYALAFGKAKQPALRALLETPVDLQLRPGQILQELNEAYLYNDQVGGTT